jgi:hypothetical protein
MSSDHIIDDLAKSKLPFTRVRVVQRSDGLPDLPLGCPEGILLISNETDEQRAFRRFPITSHKPGTR